MPPPHPAPPRPPAPQEINTGIERLASLKRSLLAPDREVTVDGINSVVHLKLAVEQLLKQARTAIGGEEFLQRCTLHKARALAPPAALTRKC